MKYENGIIYYMIEIFFFTIFFYSICSTNLLPKAGRKYLLKDTKWVLTTVINRSKFLSIIVSSYRTLKLNVSPLFKKIKSNNKK